MFNDGDPMAKASAQGKDLEKLFTGDGVGPTEFPNLDENQYLFCVFRDEDDNPHAEIVEDLEGMIQYFNAAKYGIIQIDEWRISEIQLDN